MTMNESNIDCLLACAEIILQCSIKTFSAFKDISLFYKIINEPIVDPDIDKLLKKLTDIFNTDIKNIIDIDNNDHLSDLEIAKILLLCVVVYILFIDYNDKSNTLINLCDNIPISLHQNACTMFGPFIMKHSDKTELTHDDLDNALLVNDKENQTTYFSPIREKQRPHLINEKIITEQKRKIHKDIKAFQAFDPFPINTPGSSSFGSLDENRSPLVKLLQFVQSPKFQGKSLMKANRELEKRLRQLEHQLDASAIAEKELQASIGEEKQRRKRLEKELRQEQEVVHTKDDIITEKDREIERLQHYATQNRRLDEKMRDYQDKTNEIQLLSGQLEDKCQENKLLRIENRELSHFKALAIDRRLKIEHLTGEVNNHKNNFHELQATRIRLSETESQLVELQNHMHSLQRNHANNDSLSEMSLNSSFVHSECAPHFLEMERDQLRSELMALKEETVPKSMHEEFKRELDNISSDLIKLKARLEVTKEEVDSSETIENFEFPFSGIDHIDHIKQVILEMHDIVALLHDKTAKLSFTNTELLSQLNDHLIMETNLNSTIESMRSDIENKNKCFAGIGSILFGDQQCDMHSDGFMDDVMAVLLANDQSLGQCRATIDTLQAQLRNDLQALRDSVSHMSKSTELNLTSFLQEIVLFKQSLCDPSVEISGTNATFFRSLNKLLTDAASLQEEIERLKGQNQILSGNLANAFTEHEDQLKTLKRETDESIRELSEKFSVTKNELITKHNNEILEMRTDISRLVAEYQECLTNLENASSDFEDKMKIKDDEIRLDKLTLIQFEKDIISLRTEIESLTDNRNSLLENVEERNQEILMMSDNLAKELSLKDDIISEMRQQIASELNNSQIAQTQLDLMTIEFENRLEDHKQSSGTELVRLSAEIFDLESRLVAKDDERKSVVENHYDELSRLSRDIETKNGEISKLQCQIETKRLDLETKDEKLSQLQNIQVSIENMYRITLDELNSMKTIKHQYEELKEKYDNVVQQSIESTRDRDNELHFKKSELVKSHNEINKLRSELSASTDKLEQHSKLLDKCRQDLKEEMVRNEQESTKKIEEITRLNLWLEEKNQLLDDHKGNIERLEKLLNQLRLEQDDTRMECEYLAVIDQKYVELTKDHQELERRFEKCHKELEESTRLRAEETENLKCKNDHLEEREKQLEAERRENMSTISRLNGELLEFQANIKALEDKCLQIQQEGALELQSRLSEEGAKYSDALGTKINTIENLHSEITKLEAENEYVKSCSSEYLEKISVLENALSTRKDEIKSLTDTLDDGLMKMDELRVASKARHVCGDKYDREMRDDNGAHLSRVEWKRSQFINGISQMDSLAAHCHRLHLSNEADMTEKIHTSAEEIDRLQNTILDHKVSLELMQDQISSLANEKEMKIQQLSAAKISLEEFNVKIQNLESVIESEMVNYEKVSEEYRNVEQESHQFKEKYNKLLRQNQEKISQYETKIAELTNQINKIEEERDDQIHEMEKMFNSELKDDNCALKRSVAELTSKFNSLKNVLQEHTENEMRQLGEKYNENNRYTRMSSWGMRPQLNRQLPPIDCIDKDSLLDLGLSSNSKMKFESFVFSPYTCEDEPSISFHKHFPSNTNRIEQNIRKIEHLDNVTQVATPLKKKKDGIRQQITTKIRRSLHLESAGEAKTDHKGFPDAGLQTPMSSIRKDETPMIEKGSNKPPIAPRKNISAKLRSSQVSVIDLDEYRQRHDKKRVAKSHGKKERDDNQESINSVTSTTPSNLVPSKSVCSLFDRTDQDLMASPTRESGELEMKSLDSPFTQRAKTPKPNSIIRRIIRKSKMRTPKMKLGSIDKLMQ